MNIRRLVPVTLLLFGAACGGADTLDDSPGGIFENLEEQRQVYQHALDQTDALTEADVRKRLAETAARNREALVKALEGADRDRKMLACFGLGFARDKTVIPVLLKATEDPVPAVRQNAAGALGIAGYADTPVDPLRHLLGDPSPGPRVAALFALHHILQEGADPGFLPDLRGMLDDVDPAVRAEAALVFMKLRRADGAAALSGRLEKETDTHVRVNCLLAMGNIRKPDLKDPEIWAGVATLIESMRDEMQEVIDAGWIALRRLTGKDFDPTYQVWRNWYEQEEEERRRAAGTGDPRPPEAKKDPASQ